MRRLILPLYWIACLGSAMAQVPIRSGTGTIAGTVVSDGVPSQPVRRVTVTLSDAAGGAGARAAVTDDDGRFTFSSLPAGRYLVSTFKAAYLPTAYGVSRPIRPGAAFTGTAISLGDGQRFDGLTLRITRGSVVTGTVRSPDGRPVRDAQIFLAYFRRAPETGVRTLTPLLPNAGTASDSRGIYRIFGVPPGEYVVVLQMPYGLRDFEQTSDADVQRVAELLRSGGVVPGVLPPGASPTPAPSRPRFGYAPIFFPGTPVLAEALTVALGPGEERSGVDFEVRLVPNARIVGTAVAPDGRPVAAQVTATSVVGGADFLGQFALSDAKGQFTVTGIEPGNYSIEAQLAPGSTGPRLAGRTEIAIGTGSDVSVTVTLQPGVSVSGRLAFEASAVAPPIDLSRVRVTVSRDGAGIGSASAAPTADGAFTVANVFPGRYRLNATLSGASASGGAAWVIKSATVGDRDVVDGTFDVAAGDIAGAVVTMTSRVSEISGVIQDAGGHAAPEYFIIAFPADRDLWRWNSRRILQTRPSHDGAFAFRNLPPGEYLIGAVTDVEQNEWFEPAFLEALAGASVKLTLAEGQKAVQPLRIR